MESGVEYTFFQHDPDFAKLFAALGVLFTIGWLGTLTLRWWMTPRGKRLSFRERGMSKAQARQEEVNRVLSDRITDMLEDMAYCGSITTKEKETWYKRFAHSCHLFDLSPKHKAPETDQAELKETLAAKHAEKGKVPKNKFEARLLAIAGKAT